MGGVGLLETPLGVLRSFCFIIAKRGFWLGDRMESVGKAPVCEEIPLRISAALVGFGSRCSKLRFSRNLGFPRCFGRVLQLRESAIGGAALVLSCSSG